VTKDFSQFWLTREQLNRLVERTQHFSRCAQWGDIPKALDWLETAYRLPDPGIGTLRVDSLVDPLRKEPRFQEIERKLQLPN
jgi:hypothetical protein